MSRYSISLSSWIIQDGNYSDFHSGDHVAFAVECSGFGLLLPSPPPANGRPTAHLTDDDLYEVTGQIVHWTEQWQCLDIGIVSFCQQPPILPSRQGQWVNGWIDLAVDSYFYAAQLSLQPDAPPRIYDWEIEAIEMRVAPYIEVAPRIKAPDSQRIQWQPVNQTDAWHDQGGLAEYRLHCRLLDRRPRRSLMAAQNL